MATQNCREGYHGPHEAENDTCPFCLRPMRVEGDPAMVCAMCGMDINHPDEAARLDIGAGRTVHFCCIWCLRIYQKQVEAETYRIMEEAAANMSR